MTTFIDVEKKCACCGHEFTVQEIASTNSFGSCDLDTRPPEMSRSTTRYLVSYCENCGYASYEIDEPCGYTIEQLKQIPDYSEILINDSISQPGKAFLLTAVVFKLNAEYFNAGMTYLRAAWMFDDCMDFEMSKFARENAYEMLSAGLLYEDNINVELMIVDILRRACNFEKAIKNANRLLDQEEVKQNEMFQKILKFQITLCKQENIKCYRVADAM